MGEGVHERFTEEPQLFLQGGRVIRGSISRRANTFAIL